MALGSLQINHGSLGSYIAASETFWLYLESPQMRILFCPITKEGEDAARNYWKRIHELGIERHGGGYAKCLVSGLLERQRHKRNAQWRREGFILKISQGLNGS